MAKKNETEAVKPWKATTKFYALKSLYKFQLKEGAYVMTEKGRETISDPVFLTINNTDGYTPQTEEEENRLLALEAKAGSYVIEYSRMPKSADAKQMEGDLIKERKEKEALAEELEKLKVLSRLQGMDV